MTRALIVVEERLGGDGAPSWAPRGIPLACVANKPLIAHVARSLREAGAEGVVVVADHASASHLRRALARENSSSADVDWVEVDTPVGVVEAIRAAAGVLEGERFLLHPPDGLLAPGGTTLGRALADRDSDATVFFRGRRAGDQAALHPVAALSEVAAEPARDLIRLDGVYAFGPAIFDAVESLEPGTGLLEAIQRLDAGRGCVRTRVLDGWWEFSGAQSLLDVNRRLLDTLDAAPHEADWPDGRLEGRVEIHPTAQLRGAVVRGPTVIGAGAKVVDAYVGPYTSIGTDAVVENSEVENSMLLGGASLCNVGTRVEGSILGRGASVGRDFSLPRGLRLLVGDEARLMLG